MTKSTLSRRGFLAAAGFAAAGIALPTLVPSEALALSGKMSPNERLRTGIIGYGNRGRDLLGESLKLPDFHLVAACDCFKRQKDAAADRIDEHYKDHACARYDKYEDLLARDDIDVVIVATPDHWHTKITIEACESGKDVYCEKPLTLTPYEARQIVKAVRKYNRVVTGGSQRVMEDYGYMAPVFQSGALGNILEAHCSIGIPPYECWAPEQPMPEGLDWDRWLGQAPYVPYNSWRCSGSYYGGWRNFLDYGNGFLADWGAHKFAGTLYCVGLETEEPVVILPPNCEENQTSGACAIYRNGFKIYHTRDNSHDITVIGSERTFRHNVDRGKILPIKPVEVRRYHGGRKHLMPEYAWCVRHRVRPFQDVEYPAKAVVLCQLMAFAYRLNRKLYWDERTCTFHNDPDATRLVRRVQRSPYQINFEI